MSDASATTLKSCDDPLVTAYDCAMLDLDGVVYVGEHAVDGVPEVLTEARDKGMTLAFVTNNAARPPASVAEHLTELGVEASAEDVVTSAQAAAREVAARLDPGGAVLVVGGEGLELALAEHGIEIVTSAADAPAAVVQGFHPSVGWKQLAEGAYAIRAGALWVASNLDLTVPTSRGIAPGNGALVQAVATAVGREPDVVAGKPYRPLFEETVRRIASQRPLVVGDRLDTDIEGAVRFGVDSLLLMTGVTDLDQLFRAAPEQRPTYVAWTMAALMRSFEAPRPDGGSWALEGWVASVDDTGHARLLERGPDRDAGLSAVAAACWTWLDAQDSDEKRARLDLSGLDGLTPNG